VSKKTPAAGKKAFAKIARAAVFASTAGIKETILPK
jgi:hypothetical protein